MYFDPFEEMARMHEEIDRMFQRAFKPVGTPLLENGMHCSARMPLSFLEEKGDSVLARFELPGMDKQDVELNVTKEYIEVKAGKKQEHQSKDSSHERYYSTMQQFYRRLPLHLEVDPARAVAEYRNGLLTVEIPKHGKIADQGKRVQIK